MLEIPAKTAYIDPAIYDAPNCRARLERMRPHLVCDDVREYDAAAREAVAAISRRRHGKDDFGDDTVVVFTTFDPDRKGWYYNLRHDAEAFRNCGACCQTALQLNLVDGCVFRCAYCGFGRVLVIALDVERFMAGLDEVFAQYPAQRLYKFSNMTDLPPFEPELDAVPPMVARFAREEGRYLMLFTKSDAIDFLLDLDHRGHTIVSWSMSSATPSRVIEKRTPTMEARIEAMRKAQAAGYLVRARLSPIVPVRNWRDEYGEFFEKLFAACRPDLVTLELLGWFDVEDLPRVIPVELLDPAAYATAGAAAEELHGVRSGPFTEATHQEIYRFCIETCKRLSPATPVSVCHGTPATWEALGSLMGMSPEHYICNCGPMSTPGDALYDAQFARGKG